MRTGGCLWVGKSGELMPNGVGAPVWEEGRISGEDGGDGSTTMWMYRTSLNYILKTVDFILHIFYHNTKKSTTLPGPGLRSKSGAAKGSPSGTTGKVIVVACRSDYGGVYARQCLRSTPCPGGARPGQHLARPAHIVILGSALLLLYLLQKWTSREPSYTGSCLKINCPFNKKKTCGYRKMWKCR